MKKFFSFMLAFCMIIPCVFMLSACKDDKDPKVIYVNVETMQELKNALTNTIENDVIVLKANFDLKEDNENESLTIEAGKHVIDLNGFTLKGVDAGESNWHVIILKGDNTELTIKDSSTDKTGTIEARCYGIQVSHGAKLTIESGNFISTQNPQFNQSVVVYGGELIVNGGEFTANVYDVIYGKAYTWDQVDYNNKITINGGTFNSIGEEDSEFSLLLFEGSNQEVIINGGIFNNNKLELIVGCDSTTEFTNNANIPEEKIAIWEV